MFTAGIFGPLKRILLLRHAKAEPADGFASDHDRSLAERGRLTSAALGPVLAAAAWAPDEVFCSTARRTRETWQVVEAAGHLVTPVFFRPELYEASVGRVLDVVADASVESGSVLVVGHEPTMSGTLRALTGRLTGSFRTGALAVVRFERATTWAECVPGEGQLEAWIEP